MKHKQTVIILIACAVLAAIGSYLLFMDTQEDTSEYKDKVMQPAVEAPSAPAWVDTGQKAKPDYSTSAKDTQNATPPPTVKPEESKPKVIEFSEDSTVTFTFVESLANFLLYRFQPQNPKGKPTTTASIKALNMYYGRELDGFSVEKDSIRESRKTLLDYAFTPAMIKTLYALYEPVFVAHLVDTAETDEREYKIKGVMERRTLGKEEIVAMLRLDARQIEQIALVFDAIATDPSITQSAGKYLRAAKAVERANLQLQLAIADEKDTSKASQRLKQAILQRERVKAKIISTLRQTCPGCTDSDLFYLAQWAYRRILNESEKKLDSFAAAAEILTDLTAKFRKQANEME